MALSVTRSGILLTAGIIVVAAGLIGGLLWVKNTGEQARRAEAVKIAEERLKAESERDVSLNEGGDNTSEKDQKDKNGSESSKGSQTEQKDDSGKSDDAKAGGANSDGASGSSQSAGDVTANELPQTGVADISSIIGAGALTFAAISYVASRRY